MPDDSLLDLTVTDLLAAVAAREPAPGGGAAAALAAALAAGLVAMAARFGPEGPSRAPSATVRAADLLRARAEALVDADAAAYGRYLQATRTARSSGTADDRAAARVALDDATEVPLAVSLVAVEVADLGDRVTAEGNPRLRGDATAGLLLAAAAADIAAALVLANAGPDDPRTGRARRAAARVREVAARTT